MCKAIDTKLQEEPLQLWDSMTVQKKYIIAVIASDENSVEVVCVFEKTARNRKIALLF